jgi:tyrosinase
MAAMGDTNPPRNPQTNGYGYNPRCIKRDISGYLVQRDSTYAKVAALITNSKTIGPFQDTMQASAGVHTAGHFTVSGDPGSGTFTLLIICKQAVDVAKLTRSSDFYTSPGDPYFFLHHAQIDRVWWIWQAQDFANRQQVIAGGTSMMGGGRAQSLEDSIDLEVLNVDGKAYKIKELVSTIGGPLCYVYE